MTILAAVDGEPGSERVVAAADDLATGLDQDLVVLHVVPVEDDETVARERLHALVQSVVADPAAVDLRVEPERTRRDLPTGRTADHVLAVAADVAPDYLVVGSRKRTGLGRILLGSVSKLVMANADVPVVTVEQDPADD
jgi:nucleotide-binding universal stress UspA family protein